MIGYLVASIEVGSCDAKIAIQLKLGMMVLVFPDSISISR